MISVLVPVYNAKPFLKKCIESIINQTFHNFELILIDDGSTDGSGEICDSYLSIDKRVIVKHQKNQGSSAARNAGLRIAKGNYIVFIDADDYVSDSYLELLYRNVKLNNSDVCMAKEIAVFYRDDGTLAKEVNNTTEEISGNVDETSFINYCKSKGFCDTRKLFKKSVLDNVWFDEKLGWGEDFVFMYEVARKHPHKMTTEIGAIYYYRNQIEQPSIDRWQNKKMNYVIKKLHNTCKQFTKINPKTEFELFYESCFLQRYSYCLKKFLVFQLLFLIPYRLSYFRRNKTLKMFFYSFLPYTLKFLVVLKHFFRR